MKPFNRKNTKNKIRKPRRRLVLLTLLSFVLSITVALFLGGSGLVVLIVSSMLVDTPAFEVENFNVSDSTRIFDRHGNVIADIGLHLRENIPFEELPQTVVDAFVAVEDARFFTHNGFDIPRFSAAMIGNIRSILAGGGAFSAGGGSTITMQLVKGTFFETEDALAPTTIDRKIQEIALALETERNFSKRRIFELYVNRINFGVPNSRGIQRAAQFYFGKDVQELTLSEAAYLAGVINAPTRFNAYNNLQAATERRSVVLYQMRRHGFISEAEEAAANSIPLENLLVGRERQEGRPFQAYIDTVINEVIRLTGRDPVLVPMNIFTFMDPVVQAQIDAIQSGERINFIHDLLQVGGVVMDHSNGQVIGIMGGRNYDGERLFNRATDKRNQIGSTAKGILTYPLAFEHLNISTEEVVKDVPILIAGTDNLVLRNFDRRYRGEMNVRSAFANSMNIPAYLYLERITQAIGSRRVVEFINSIGIPTNVNQYDLGFSFGGSNFAASPMQLNAAYGAIFNNGEFIQPHTVARIEFRNGNDPLIPQYASTRVISSAASYLTMELMRDAINGGFPNGMSQFRRSAFTMYGKTGTTNWGPEGSAFGIPDGAARELWVVTGNARYVMTVWVGFDKAVEGQNTFITSAINAQNYRGRIMNLLIDAVAQIQGPLPTRQRPEGVETITHILGPQPYLAPLPNTDPSLIVTGLIRSAGATTSRVPFPTPSNNPGFTASLTSSSSSTSKAITVQMTPYPDLQATQRESRTYEMELITPTQEIRATGTRLFSLSWIRGPIVYVARVVINGVPQFFVANSPTITIPLPNVNDPSIEVCTFYAYELFLDQRSNVLCQEVQLPVENGESTTNRINQSLGQIRTWLQTLNPLNTLPTQP